MTLKQSVGAEAGEKPTIWAALDAWARTLTSWQRYIVAVATKQGRLSDDEINSAYLLFLSACKLRTASHGETPVEIPPVSGRPTEPLSAKLLLTQTDCLAGINAIPDGAALTFGPELTAIYGRNGAGKSGFARLLANACFSRQKPQILGNIYAEGEPGKPSARFLTAIDNVEQPPIVFPGDLSITPLKRITVFDAAVARHHITHSSAFEYKPVGFDVFPEVVRVFTSIASRLDADIAKRSRTNDFPQSLLGGGTKVHEAVAALGPATDLTILRALASYGPAESARMEELDKQILALRAQSPEQVLHGLREAKSDVDALQDTIEHISIEFSVTAVSARHRSIAEGKEAVAAASALGTDQFKRSFFRAVGTPEWEQFVASAHTLARRERPSYAAADDRCLLCERPLDETSRDHVNSLLAFVEGDVRKGALTSQAALGAEAARLEALNFNEFSPASRVRTHVHRLAPDFEDRLAATVAALLDARTASVADLKQLTTTAAPVDPTGPQRELAALSARIAADIARLEVGNSEDAIASLELERRTLRHRHVLAQQLPAVEVYVADAAWVARALSARNSLGTRFITEKEKELFGRIVGEGYRTRLAQECSQLDCHVPVELQTVGRSGQTMRSLAMRGGHKPEGILSEGEQKAVALADFLAEVALNPASAGIVFDDPVSSQDHQRKECIARRLVKEAHCRQVIVFTHDLVFLNQLFVAAEEHGREIDAHWIDRASDGRPGQVALGDSPITSRTYENTSRAKEALARAQTLVGSEREDVIRKGMGALRTTLEETVVRKVFKDAVPRWSDQVRVTTLRRVNWDEAKVEEICTLYEELSRFIEGHSHTDEARGEPVQPTALESRIAQVDVLIRWARADRAK